MDTVGRIPERRRGRGGEAPAAQAAKDVTRTSGTSWVKRTTQGHGKCLGRSRMERTWQSFVELHKESLKKSPFIDTAPCQRAEVPIIKAIIMQFTILPHKSSIVKGFCEIICIFLLFDKNRQNPPLGSPLPVQCPYKARRHRVFTHFFQNFHPECVYKSKKIWYTIIICNHSRSAPLFSEPYRPSRTEST